MLLKSDSFGCEIWMADSWLGDGDFGSNFMGRADFWNDNWGIRIF